MKKEVIAHLKDDIKDFKKEASEDRALIKKLKGKSMKKKHVKKVSSKKKKSAKPGHAKFKKVLKEFKAGKLHSGSKKGPKVVNPKQAIAIAFSEDRRADKTAKKPKHKKK
jgi:hypothetical protein